MTLRAQAAGQYGKLRQVASEIRPGWGSVTAKRPVGGVCVAAKDPADESLRLGLQVSRESDL